MPINLRDILSFFVDFERALEQEAPPGVFERVPRDEVMLLTQFKAYFGGPIRVLNVDMYKDIDKVYQNGSSQDVVSAAIKNEELASLVLTYFENGTPTRADILINCGKRSDGSPIFNNCYYRFLVMKEAFHAILRLEFSRQNRPYPDANNSSEMLKTLEKLIFLPFAIIDFDDPDYEDDIKIENAAELLSLLILYPIDQIGIDRQQFLKGISGQPGDIDNPTVIATRTYEYAKSHLVPQRYVDLMFRWKGFPEVFALYRQLKRGY